MPRYRVYYLDEDGEEGTTEVTAPDKGAAADKAMDEHGADTIEEVEII